MESKVRESAFRRKIKALIPFQIQKFLYNFIKKFRLAINGTKERITLEVNPEHNHNAIYELRDKLCKTIPASQMTITQVGILVTFVPDPGTGKTSTRSFDVNWPNSCSLKHDGKDAIIRKMLNASGIEPRVR